MSETSDETRAEKLSYINDPDEQAEAILKAFAAVRRETVERCAKVVDERAILHDDCASECLAGSHEQWDAKLSADTYRQAAKAIRAIPDAAERDEER